MRDKFIKHSITAQWGAFVAAVLLVAAFAPSPVFADNTKFSGQATVVRATVLGVPITLSDTGPLPEEGGALEASLLDASVPGLLSVEVLHASTVGQGNASRSEASVLNLNLTVGGNTIGAGFLRSEARAVCNAGVAAVDGSSEIAQLVINGQPIEVTGDPDQTIFLPGGGTVIINEQDSSVQGNRAEMTVNALHVNIPGVADVIISSAHADIVCAGRPPCDKDFVTGGGWILVGGAKGTFAVAGGEKNGWWGHLTYIDHGSTRVKVKGTGVTFYMVTGETSRHIEGNCEINGVAGTYKVDVSDNGEPGRNDTFSLELSNGYTASGTLAGGNIQLHTCR